MSAALDQGTLQSDRYVVNHDIMNCTAEGVIGNQLYSGRALGLSEPWDIIQLHPDLKPDWPAITEHYQRIGLRHSISVIWDLSLKHLGTHIGFYPSVFYFGPKECTYWGDQDWLEAVEFINSKNNFMELAEKLNVDVPITFCFDRIDDITTDHIKSIVYPCYLKAAISVSGVGIYRCADEEQFLEAKSKFDDSVPVQIQEEVITETFLNLQYRIVDDEVIRLTASEQILDGFVHQGNRVPASHEPWENVDAMAYWLKDNGMKGIFAFDVAIMQTEQGLRFPAIECNPRFNGASYPTMIAQKMNISEWSSITLKTQHRSLNDFDFSGLEYDHQTGEGLIIVNWGTISVGKISVLLAGSKDYQHALAVELEARL